MLPPFRDYLHEHDDLRDEIHIAYHVDRSRLGRLAESPLGWLLPLARHRRLPAIWAITREPIRGARRFHLEGR
jgi:hypothetical protein